MSQDHVLTGGFAAPPQEAARAFRAALEAMARPGRVQMLRGAEPPEPLSVAAGTLLLTLCDTTTPVHLAPSHDTAAVRGWIAFHCGAPVVPAEEAAFAVGRWDALQPVTRFAIGTADYPDRSATLIVETEGMAPPNATLTGPGIELSHPARLPEIAAFQANRAGFPLGFDCYLCVGPEVIGLPRSTIVEAL